MKNRNKKATKNRQTIYENQMISYLKKEHWDKFGGQYYTDPNCIVIDLRECEAKEDFILAIGWDLHASNSTPLVGGYSVDALTDVVSDYYIENWRQWKEVYIVGWQRFIDLHPFYSQLTAASLINSYLTTIECQYMAIDSGDETLEKSQILDALTDNKPHVFLVLN